MNAATFCNKLYVGIQNRLIFFSGSSFQLLYLILFVVIPSYRPNRFSVITRYESGDNKWKKKGNIIFLRSGAHKERYPSFAPGETVKRLQHNAYILRTAATHRFGGFEIRARRTKWNSLHVTDHKKVYKTTRTKAHRVCLAVPKTLFTNDFEAAARRG